MIHAGQIREWVYRDAAGEPHPEMMIDILSNYFMIIGEEYTNELGIRVVDFMEIGQIYTNFEVEHLEYWSLPVVD